MAKGNKIQCSDIANGRLLQGILTGTPKPGTHMQLDAGVEPVNGRYTWEVYNQAADGTEALVAVLLDDWKQGKTATEAFVAGDFIEMYCPLPGDEMNILFDDPSGTDASSDIAIGDRFEIDDGTGLVNHEASGLAVWVALETYADLTADQLVHMMFIG